MPNFSTTCCSSPADGVAGAVILQVDGDKGPKYFFNAPEGFARVALEHKLRPSKLRAAFVTQLHQQSLGGMAALIMRLRQDGHEELQVYGPRGLASNLHALRHFVRWKHPKVFAKEHVDSYPPIVFEDGHVDVVALHKGENGPQAAWPCPPWLQPQAQSVRAANFESAKAKPSLHSSKGDEAGSETSNSDGEDGNSSSSSSSASSEAENSEGKSGSDSSVRHDLPGKHPTAGSKQLPAAPALSGSSMFDQLDTIFSSGAHTKPGSAQFAALEVLKQAPAKSKDFNLSLLKPWTAPPKPAAAPDSLALPNLYVKNKAAKSARPTKQAQQANHAQQASHAQQAQQAQQGQRARQAGDVTAALTKAAKDKHSSQKKGSGEQPASGTAAEAAAPRNWEQIEEGGNPVYAQWRVNRDRVAKDVFDDMWGYLVHLKSTGQLLLMLHNTNGLHSIQQHPVFQYMQQQSHRVAGVFHLTPVSPSKEAAGQMSKKKWREIALNNAYHEWISTLPGQQVILNGQQQHVFQSSLRATAKLHLLSPAVFPLPFALPAVPAGHATPAGPAGHAGHATPAVPDESVQDAMPAEPAGHPTPAVPAEPAGHPTLAEPGVQTGNTRGNAAAEAAGKVSETANQPRVCTWLEFKNGEIRKSGPGSKVMCVGPVATLAGGVGKALAVMEADPDAEVRTPEQAQREVLHSKPDLQSFIAQLKAEHPALFKTASFTAQHMKHPTRKDLAAAAAAQRLSRQQKQEDTFPLHMTMLYPAAIQQQQQMQHAQQAQHAQQHGTAHSAQAGSCNAYGFISADQGQFPSAPAGYALVPVTPDGKLHYPGAISNPWQGSAVHHSWQNQHAVLHSDSAWQPNSNTQWQHPHSTAAPQHAQHQPQHSMQSIVSLQHPVLASSWQQPQHSMHSMPNIEPPCPPPLSKHPAHQQAGLPHQAQPQQPSALVDDTQPCRNSGRSNVNGNKSTGMLPPGTFPIQTSSQTQQGTTLTEEASPSKRRRLSFEARQPNACSNDAVAGNTFSSLATAKQQGALNWGEVNRADEAGQRSEAAPEASQKPSSNADAAAKLKQRLKMMPGHAMGSSNTLQDAAQAQQAQHAPQGKPSQQADHTQQAQEVAEGHASQQASHAQQAEHARQAQHQLSPLQQAQHQSIADNQAQEPGQPEQAQQAQQQPQDPNQAQEQVQQKPASQERAPTPVQCDDNSYKGLHGPEQLKDTDKTEVVFLGTGSAEPSKYRGATAIHLRLGNGWGVLLDAGEGTWGGLVRMYGHMAAQQEVENLAFVWISHKHADHMLGLASVLAVRKKSVPPLLVIGPREASSWLYELSQTQQSKRDQPNYTFMPSHQFTHPSLHQMHMFGHTGLTLLQSVPVDHCYDAYGLVMQHASGWKLVWSGDTRPCKALQAAGKDCTLLIHEATFAPELQGHAWMKKHSTSVEAMQVAQGMGAYRTILTHLSQRYSKVPFTLAAEGPAAGSSMIAFDGMRVPFALLPVLPKLLTGVTSIFAVEEEENLAIDGMLET